jgi:hypothetical protein
LPASFKGYGKSLGLSLDFLKSLLQSLNILIAAKRAADAAHLLPQLIMLGFSLCHCQQGGLRARA